MVFIPWFSDEKTAIQLVTDPAVKSNRFYRFPKSGGWLFNAAVNRAEPIPVYAEMSAVNPVLMPDAVAANANGIAQGLVTSVTMGGSFVPQSRFGIYG